MEHTKGPWKLDRRSENLVGPDGTHVRVYGSGLSFSGLPDDVARANSRLIWAAPELYEALMALRSFMWAEGYADQNIPMAQADAAIEKAEASVE